MILALETATNICSVSFEDEDGNIHEKRTEKRGSHSELLFIFIRELMQDHQFKISDLDAVLVSNGPGSYTGLRIAASAVKGLLFGLDVQVYAANTLSGFAESAINIWKNENAAAFSGRIHAVINARRSHLYHQQFKVDEGLKSTSEAKVIELTEIEKRIHQGDIIVGTGIERLNEKCRTDVTEYGLEAVNANALISLFRKGQRDEFFTRTSAEKLESNYISSSQV